MQFSFASVVEDVLQQQSKRLSDIDLASRMAEEACMIVYSLMSFSLLIFFSCFDLCFYYLHYILIICFSGVILLEKI